VLGATTVARRNGGTASGDRLLSRGREEMAEDNLTEEIPIRGIRPGDLEGVLGLARRTGVFTSEEVAVVKELVEAEMNNPQ